MRAHHSGQGEMPVEGRAKQAPMGIIHVVPCYGKREGGRTRLPSAAQHTDNICCPKNWFLFLYLSPSRHISVVLCFGHRSSVIYPKSFIRLI